MKLILSSSLLLATSSSISAQSSLSSALHPRDLIKDTNFKLASLSRALSLDIHRLPTRSRRNRTRRAQSCEETRSDALEEEFDRLRENYYNEIICDESGNCQWDASPLKDEGIFDVAVAECEDGGGILYLVKTQISCEDGSSHSLIDIPFSCNADCGDGSLFELFFPSSVPAATFLEMTLPRINLTTTCVYEDFSIDVLASEGTESASPLQSSPPTISPPFDPTPGVPPKSSSASPTESASPSQSSPPTISPPFDPTPEVPPKSSTSLTIGLICGGGAIVMVLLGVAAFVVRRRQKTFDPTYEKTPTDQDQGNENSSSPLSSFPISNEAEPTSKV